MVLFRAQRIQGPSTRSILVALGSLPQGASGKKVEDECTGGHGRVCPEPRTWYLKVQSCSTPTGPRAWNRPVAKPNSPPSANWVEALWSTIAESTSLRNRSAAD